MDEKMHLLQKVKERGIQENGTLCDKAGTERVKQKRKDGALLLSRPGNSWKMYHL